MTTTIWRFAGAVEERRAVEEEEDVFVGALLNEAGGSLEWRSIALGRRS